MDDWKTKLKMRLPALALLVSTVVFWSFYDRYEPVGPMLLELPTLADATRSSGEVSESGGRFSLNVPESGQRADIRFRLPAATHYEFIRVRARIKVDGVVAGKYAWRCARLLLVQYDTGNKWIPGHHGVVAERGCKDWESHEDVCAFGGSSYLYALYFETGTPFENPAFENGTETVTINNQDKIKISDKKSLGEGQASSVGIHVGNEGAKSLIQQSTGVIVSEELHPAFTFKSSLRSWLQK